MPRVFFSTRHPLPTCFAAELTTLKTEPKTYKQALKDPNWRQAMQAEIYALHANQIWTLVPPPSDMSLVTSKWVFKTKTRAD